MNEHEMYGDLITMYEIQWLKDAKYQIPEKF